MLKIYMTNLNEYVAGKLIGEWVDCESQEEMQAAYKKVSRDGLDETFISDYESDVSNLDIEEYEDLDSLHELAENIEDMNEDEREIFGIACGEFGRSEALDIMSDSSYMVYYDCYDMGDVAQQYMDETGGLDTLPEWAQGYFDYDALGRDMETDGYFVELDNEPGYVEFIR